MSSDGATWYDIADNGKLTNIDSAKPAIELAMLDKVCFEKCGGLVASASNSQ